MAAVKQEVIENITQNQWKKKGSKTFRE
jgi:hypothetical protein